MALRREPVTLHFDTTGFTARMRRMAEVAGELHRRDRLRDATWEPHDWSEWKD